METLMHGPVVLMDDLTQTVLGRFASVDEALASAEWAEAAQPTIVPADEEKADAEAIHAAARVALLEWKHVRDAANVGAVMAAERGQHALAAQLRDVAAQAAQWGDPVTMSIFGGNRRPDRSNRLYSALLAERVTTAQAEAARAKLARADAERRAADRSRDDAARAERRQAQQARRARMAAAPVPAPRPQVSAEEQAARATAAKAEAAERRRQQDAADLAAAREAISAYAAAHGLVEVEDNGSDRYYDLRVTTMHEDGRVIVLRTGMDASLRQLAQASGKWAAEVARVTRPA